MAEKAFLNDEDNPTVTLRDAIDLNELRKDDGQGITFEVDENAEDYPNESTGNDCFDGEERLKYLYHPEDDDSDEDDDDDDSTPFERLARKMEDICPLKDGGILKMLVKHGSGDVVPVGSLVRVHYNAYLEYADEPYDSSRLQGKEKKFRIGEGEVIEGLDFAVSTMRKGEIAKFLIKSEYALKTLGNPPRIPPEATALFEVELLNFVEQAGLEDYFMMTEDEKRNVSFADVKKLYHSITKEAKQYFQEHKEKQAFVKYKKACHLLEERTLKDEEEEKEHQALLLRVYLNMALCCIKLGHSGRAIVYCKRSLDIENKNPKALYFYGKAHHQLGNFEISRDYLKRAQRLKPKDRDVNAELEKVEKDMANFRLVEKDMYKKMFSKPQDQTSDEKKAEEERIERAKDRSLQCSQKFKDLVQTKLKEFVEDHDLMELPMPSYNMTVGEIACIEEEAENLNLDVKVRGEGNSRKLHVMKKHPESP